MSQQSFILSDGANDAALLNTTPSGTEYGLAVRIIGSAAGGTSSLFTSAFPSSGTAVGFYDGTNMQGARVFDLDSGGGTEYVLGTNLRFTSSGGSVEAGTASNPLRIDPTGTTTQPISGTVTANAGTGTFTISGTVTANQGGTWTVQPGNTQNTTAWLTQDAADGPVTPGAVASKSILFGGQYNTVLPTLTNTQQAAVQVDSNGRLLVGSIASALPTGANVIGAVTQSGGPWTTNQTQINGSAVATLTAGEQKVAVEGLAADGYAPVGNPVLIAGSDGTNTQTVLTDATGKIVTTIIPATGITSLIQGRVIGASGTQIAIRGTTYTEQTANFIGSIKSSSASDTSAGTGARQVTIYYVDSTGATAGSEVVSLNGTTAVNLSVSTKCFIEKIVVTSVGSSGWNLGTITLYTGSGGTGTIVGTIGFATVSTARGDNTTLWAHHYIVTGKTMSIATITAGTNGNQAGIIFLMSALPTVANSVEQQISDVLCLASSSDGIFRGASYPIKVSGPARVTAYVVPSGSNTNFFCGFEYLEQ